MLRRLSLTLAILAIFVALWGAACSPAPSGGELSVLLISPDSLRADRLGPWNPQAPPTPHLDTLAARGTLYRNTWSNSPWTAPSMVSVMSGLAPPGHGVIYRDDTTPPKLPTLPRLLSERGAAVGNFTFFAEISYFRNLGLGTMVKGTGHRGVAASFRRWLEEDVAGGRYFAWLHLLEPHLPYGADGYRATEVQLPGSTGLEASQLQGTVPVGSVQFAAEDREPLLALYDHDVERMDQTLGEIVAVLEELRRDRDTVVIFVADHGEELLEHGWVGHASTSIEAKLVPEILRIPLILAGPGVPAGQVREELVQQVDILPTIARLVGIEAPKLLDGGVLPGLGKISGGLWSRLTRPARKTAFFDTSPGGNLTPQDRRGERLQGVTDGHCLVTVHSFSDGPEVRVANPVSEAACAPGAVERLSDELQAWRSEQASQRLEILARYGAGEPPEASQVEGFAETLQILTPEPGRLDWHTTGGQIALEHSGDDGTVWIEYHLGRPPLAVRGSFAVEQRRVVFGPVPQGYWNDLAGFSPFRLRVVDPAGARRSPWVEYEVLEAR